MIATTVEAPPFKWQAKRGDRDEVLDWTKGFLVVCMVIYHSINYSEHKELAFRFLSFLPPSFILITGFLVGLYRKRYDLTSWKPYVRLWLRGFKLLLIFCGLNVLYYIGSQHAVGKGFWGFWTRAGDIFFTGNGRFAIFEVLLPIAYFLMLAPLLLGLANISPIAVPVCALLLFSLCTGLELAAVGTKNLSLLSAGVLGMAFSAFSSFGANRVREAGWIVAGLYVLYRLMSYCFGEPYPIQMLAAAASVVMIYFFGSVVNSKNSLNDLIVLLGKYSLLGYLGQIAILRVLAALIGHRVMGWLGVLAGAVITLVLTFAVVRVADVLRKKTPIADTLYRVTLG
jgi:hypothetical protein